VRGAWRPTARNAGRALPSTISALNDFFAPFIPVGFYYKTFMWPRRAWYAIYEPRIRAAAGLGKAPALPDPDCYATRFAHCDVLVVGAGPAGLAAAAAAAADGARVILCDEQAQAGGSLLDEDLGAPCLIEGQPGPVWLRATLATLAANPQVTLLTRTTAFGYFPHNLVGLSERLTEHLATPAADAPRERQWQVRAREVVLAAGAIERPLVFPGNDRPGIMLAGAARTWLNRYGVLPGTRAVLVTACDEAYGAALELQQAGVYLACIADTRAAGEASARAREAGIPVLHDACVLGTQGRRRVNAIELASVNAGELTQRQTQPCDLVLMSGGYTPSVHLHSQARGKLTWSEALQAFIPGAPVERTRSAGACRGVLARAAAVQDGAAAGTAAAGEALDPARAGVEPAGGRGRAPPAPFTPAQTCGFVGALPRSAQARGRSFVDWQNDVTAKDLALALREGFAPSST
jgi:sarcosine oxidase subunit alpha